MAFLHYIITSSLQKGLIIPSLTNLDNYFIMTSAASRRLPARILRKEVILLAIKNRPKGKNTDNSFRNYVCAFFIILFSIIVMRLVVRGLLGTTPGELKSSSQTSSSTAERYETESDAASHEASRIAPSIYARQLYGERFSAL
jgi:hypothetical protein